MKRCPFPDHKPFGCLYCDLHAEAEHHRARERAHLQALTYSIKNGLYDTAFRDLVWALQQSTMADAKEKIVEKAGLALKTVKQAERPRPNNRPRLLAMTPDEQCTAMLFAASDGVLYCSFVARHVGAHKAGLMKGAREWTTPFNAPLPTLAGYVVRPNLVADEYGATVLQLAKLGGSIHRDPDTDDAEKPPVRCVARAPKRTKKGKP